MPNHTVIYLSFCLLIAACGQNSSSEPKQDFPTSQTKQANIILQKQQLFDTNRITILSIDTTKSWFPRWLFKDAVSVKLTNQEIQETESLLRSCLKAHNLSIATSTKFSEYIELTKYRQQYVAFVSSKGEKKVFVNCFCIDDIDFTNWKKELILVEDGGLCFINVTINLTTHTYEQIDINGLG